MPEFVIPYEAFLLAHQGGKPWPPTMQIGFGAFLWFLAALLLWTRGRNSHSIDEITAPSRRARPWPVAIVLFAMGYTWMAPALGWPRPAFGVQLAAYLFAMLAIGILCYFGWTAFKYVSDRLQKLTGTGDLEIVPTLDSLLHRDEKVIWTGAPNPAAYRDPAWAMFVFGFIPFAAGCAGVSLTVVNLTIEQLTPMLAIPLVAAIGFSAIGVYAILTPWRIRSMLKESTYAITNQRAIVIRGIGTDSQGLPCRLKKSAYTFDLPQIAARRIKRISPKRIDIVFGQEQQGQGRGGPRLFDVGFVACSAWKDAETQLQALSPRWQASRAYANVSGQTVSAKPLSLVWFVQLLPYAIFFSPLLFLAGMMTLVGLSDLLAPRGLGNLWVCLPPGLMIFVLLGCFAYYIFWNLPRRTIQSFQCDGNVFSFDTLRDGHTSIRVDEVCSVTEDVSGRKSGHVLRGWWINVQNAKAYYLSRYTSEAADLILLLQANPGIVVANDSA